MVIHATGKGTLESIIEWFENPLSEVSSHYLVGKDDTIVRLVPENKKAWHAGKSSWLGKSNVNDFSIGIEILNDGEEDYTDIQIEATADLVSKIMNDRKIIVENVVGHCHISPKRKVDPGEKFPWDYFRNKIGSVV